MSGFEYLLNKTTFLLDLFRDTFVDFFYWFFTETDAGILGTIAPYQLLGFTLITSYLFTRIVLGINS